MLTVLGGKGAVGGSVWEKDGGSRAFVPVEAAGSDSVHRVWGGDGTRDAGRTHEYTSWEGSEGETVLRIHRPQ